MTVLFLFLILIYSQLLQCADAGKQEFLLASYLESWSQFPGQDEQAPFPIETIETEVLTDLYAAFAVFGYTTKDMNSSEHGLTKTFTVEPLYPQDKAELYPALRKLKETSRGGLKLFLSIGGSSFNDPEDPQGMGQQTLELFSRMVSSKNTRMEFIQSAISYAHAHGFDGIDIDWEYPGDLKRGGSEKDFANFLLFLKECSKAFHQASPSLLLSFCAPPAVPYGVPEKFRNDPDRFYLWLKQCSNYADRITLMAYNYHTPFDGGLTGANAPLHQDTLPQSDLCVGKTLDKYLASGIPPEKLLLGIPAYGWAYHHVEDLSETHSGPGQRYDASQGSRDSFLPYFEIAHKTKNKNFSFKVDSRTDTAYCYNLIEKTWISFDNPETVSLKVREALQRNLRGVIFWAINLDDYEGTSKYPLLNKAYKEKVRAGDLYYR